MTQVKTFLKQSRTFIILNIVDAVLTIASLQFGLQEANSLYYILGPYIFFGVKILLTFVIYELSKIGSIKERTMFVLNIIMSIICLWNTILILVGTIIFIITYINF